MSQIVIAGDTSGTITLQAPAVSGSNTITLPASTGTMMVNGPAFSGYSNSTATISTSVFTLVPINVKTFDTNTNFSTSTYTFTPTVAGYYQINVQASLTSTVTVTRTLPAIYKNGSAYKYGSDSFATSVNRGNASDIVYLNGSTDNVSFYVLGSGSGTLSFAGSAGTDNYFSAAMIRSA